jgi:excisionase family DNA binding protein
MNTRKLEPLLTVRDVGYLLRLTRQTLAKLITSGQLHTIKINGSYRFSADDVEKYVRGCRQ